MKITILGSGSFFIDKEHSAPAYLIQAGGKNILFDCGPGTMVQMAKIGFNPEDLDYIFISHFHSDHTSDLIPMLVRPYVLETFYGGKYDKVLEIVGPKGTKEYIKKIAELNNHSFVDKFSKFNYREYGNQLDSNGFMVNSFKVEHIEMDAYALRLEAEGKVFTYTGDSVLSPGVVEAAKNADLLITDGATPKKYPANAHLGTHQVGEICRDNGVKKVILSHQVPPGYNVDMVGEVKEVWPEGDVVLARDLMEMEV